MFLILRNKTTAKTMRTDFSVRFYSYEICKLFERKYTNNLQIK